MNFLMVGMMTICLSSFASASEKIAKRRPASPAQCGQVALKAATYVDSLGWGEVKSEPLKIVSAQRFGVSNELIKLKSIVSGYIYHVEIVQDYRSEACIITEIKTAIE